MTIRKRASRLTAAERTRFDDVVTALNYHNVVHGWVGGTMNDIMVSPADPLFWMHHAEIDRIWSIWQAHPGNAGKGPTSTAQDATLDPRPETADQVASFAALGYSYAP
jgi:tyrosinase